MKKNQTAKSDWVSESDQWENCEGASMHFAACVYIFECMMHKCERKKRKFLLDKNDQQISEEKGKFSNY